MKYYEENKEIEQIIMTKEDCYGCIVVVLLE